MTASHQLAQDAQTEHQLSQVDAFGRRFLWNPSLFNKLDSSDLIRNQGALLFSKDDKDDKDSSDNAPKGFERFFKKK